MRNEKSGGRSGKGYYIALVLCAAAIGITSYVTRPSKDKQPDTPPLLQAESAETASSAADPGSGGSGNGSPGRVPCPLLRSPADPAGEAADRPASFRLGDHPLRHG